ncbi:uncharacterized protein LOC129412371 isoform X2 [Boleophthalmus pectinirostris]|uniref:uncharacterized protein LOC129412371 isoform X2 n=1 Tax=Boleophthalmus pectinirostris TaxID=150288 RepID=UPI00242AA2DA|nr:uncharacterized protein LOC129412371 isoform X2 [Boleophthalmus pectinirostris]
MEAESASAKSSDESSAGDKNQFYSFFHCTETSPPQSPTQEETSDDEDLTLNMIPHQDSDKDSTDSSCKCLENNQETDADVPHAETVVSDRRLSTSTWTEPHGAQEPDMKLSSDLDNLTLESFKERDLMQEKPNTTTVGTSLPSIQEDGAKDEPDAAAAAAALDPPLPPNDQRVQEAIAFLTVAEKLEARRKSRSLWRRLLYCVSECITDPPPE